MNDIEDILNQLEEKIGSYKQDDDEYIFKDCIFCGNPRWNLQVNFIKNAVHCWACDWSGNINKLLKYLNINQKWYGGDFKQNALEPTKDAELPEGVIEIEQSKEKDKIMLYLKTRGISEEDIKKYNIKWWKDKGRIIFIFYDSFGDVLFWTARTIYKNVSPKYLHSSATKKDKLFYLEGEDKNTVWIVEGIFDGIRLHKEGKSVLILLGSSITDNIIDFLRFTKKDVVLCLDADAKSKQFEYEKLLKKYLGKDKVKSFWLEYGDVSEVGLKGRLL